MTRTGNQQALFTDDDEQIGARVINDRCRMRLESGWWVVLGSGVVIARFVAGDGMAKAHAMVSLVDQGWASQRDVALAFGCSTRTVRRQQRRYEEGGLSALGRKSGYPKGRPRQGRARIRAVTRLRGRGVSNREIARRLGVTENAIRKLVRRLGHEADEPRQETLLLPMSGAHPMMSASAGPCTEQSSVKKASAAQPNLSGSEPDPDEPLVISLDADPTDRTLDRMLAYLGLLDDAAPIFDAGKRIPNLGVLLAVPALVQSGIFTIVRDIYGSIGPAFYGLRTTMVTLLFMALLRVKRPEALKEHSPRDLGRLLGLDRAPEVKTLRRKLARLAASGRAGDLRRALAERRVAARGDALGFLYVDDHVRVYHGKHKLPKTHVTRMRIALPATTDYWVNDAAGEPLFVVTAQANAGMVKMLPTVLDEVRQLIGERQVTIVFDRGGWSPKLFKQLIADGFDIMTYRKGRSRRVPNKHFREHRAVIDGREVAYTLADQGILLLKRSLRLRQVTRLSVDGHQTPIVTSRRDLSAIEVAYRMFSRWRQENFFKYLREEYALDALVDYAIEPDDPMREVPNPKWKELDRKLRKARAEVAELSAQYGLEGLVNEESQRRTMRGFKIANAKLGKEIQDALRRYVEMEAKRAKVPRRVPVKDTVGTKEVVKLAAERKLLTDLLKMVAYQAEGDLVRLLAPHYHRADDEGRTLIRAALRSAGALEVSGQELVVRLVPLSSAHRTRALTAVCTALNATRTVFPGTESRLRYLVGGRARE